MNYLRQIFVSSNIIENKSEFKKENLMLALQRIRIICAGILFFSLYYFYADFVALRNADPTFRSTLISGHLIGFILSTLFLVFYKTIKGYNNNTAWMTFISRGFIVILLLMGSLPAISNQRFTGNIDAYIIVTLITAVGFPFEPLFMFVCLILNHIIFMVGIYLYCNNNITLVSKQINSTAMLTAAILFCYALYRNRVLEFDSKYRLMESEYVFKKLFSVNPLPLYITRFKDGQMLMSNDKAHDFYSYSKEEFSKIYAKDLYVNQNDRDFMLNKLHNLSKIDSYITEQKCKSGATKWIIANHELIQYRGEACILTSVTDITGLKKIENELLSHASFDALTGVLNRGTGIELLRTKLDSCKDEGTSLVVCFIDIDGLKSTNDNYGHNEGDFLITTVCDVIKNNIRETDIFFRYGGDEFVIVFSDKNTNDVDKIWSRIQTKFEELNADNLKPYKISASHGLFECNCNDSYTIEEILRLADQKMYVEKGNKKR